MAVLWCGVQIPTDAKPGKYSGDVDLSFTAEPGLVLHCDFDVMPDFIRDGGVDQPWRLARLKWLNSTSRFLRERLHLRIPPSGSLIER